MNSLIIAFPKIEDAKRIRDVLSWHDFYVDAVCTTASQALGEINDQDSGVLICGYKLPDMFFTELHELLPDGFEMLLIASERVLSSYEDSGIMSLSQPLSVNDLVATVRMMNRRIKMVRKNKKTHSKKDQSIIDEAKSLLMERNHLTESEAHRYLQKRSMENGTNLIETAEMVITLMNY